MRGTLIKYIFSRACETLEGPGGVKSVDYVSERVAFFSNKICLSNFRESAN